MPNDYELSGDNRDRNGWFAAVDGERFSGTLSECLAWLDTHGFPA